MKVEPLAKEPRPFRPAGISILFETLEEAEIMWAICNHSWIVNGFAENQLNYIRAQIVDSVLEGNKPTHERFRELCDNFDTSVERRFK